MSAASHMARLAATWHGSAYTPQDVENKARFHSLGRARLRMLAKALQLPAGSFDIRSNQGGMAVSGEVTLHGERLYVQLSHGSSLPGIMFRTCAGRRDYGGGQTSGPNNFAPLRELDAVPELAERIRRATGV